MPFTQRQQLLKHPQPWLMQLPGIHQFPPSFQEMHHQSFIGVILGRVTVMFLNEVSIEVLRTNLPTLVRRCALGSRLPSADVCQLQSVRFISSPDTDLRSFSSHGIPLNQHLLTPSHTALHLHNSCLHCPQFQPS